MVGLRCSEACGATVELQVSRRLARRLGLRRTRILAGGSARLQSAGTTYAFVRFDRRARGRLFRSRKMSAKLTAVAVDDGGNRRSLSRPVDARPLMRRRRTMPPILGIAAHRGS